MQSWSPKILRSTLAFVNHNLFNAFRHKNRGGKQNMIEEETVETWLKLCASVLMKSALQDQGSFHDSLNRLDFFFVPQFLANYFVQIIGLVLRCWQHQAILQIKIEPRLHQDLVALLDKGIKDWNLGLNNCLMRGAWGQNLKLEYIFQWASLQAKWYWMREASKAEIDYMQNTPFSLSIPSHNCIVVHAGMVPGIPLEEQELFDLIEASIPHLLFPNYS